MQRNKKNFQMTKHLHRDLSTTNQKNRPFGLQMTKHLHRDLSTTNQKNRPFGLFVIC